MSTSLTWYHYRLFGWDRNISWEAGKDQPGPTTRSYWNKISLSMETGFYYDTIYPVFNFAYDCNTGSTVFAGAIRFAPGDHWRWLVIYQQINEAKSSAGKDMGRYQDQVIFSMRYEF